MQLERLNHLPSDFDELVKLSEQENISDLKQMQLEWEEGSNTFSKEGEALFAITDKGRTLGICGLNRDPYTEEKKGRVSHMYVRPESRGQKIGERLLVKVIKKSFESFPELRLRSEDEKASGFYHKFGFSKIDGPDATHVWKCD